MTKRSEPRKEAANVVGPEVRPSVFLVDDELSIAPISQIRYLPCHKVPRGIQRRSASSIFKA